MLGSVYNESWVKASESPIEEKQQESLGSEKSFSLVLVNKLKAGR